MFIRFSNQVKVWFQNRRMKFKRQSKHVTPDDKDSSIRSRSRSEADLGDDEEDNDNKSVSSSRSTSPAVDSTTADCLLNTQPINSELVDNDSNSTPQSGTVVDSSVLSDHCFSGSAVQNNLACLEQMTCSAGTDCVGAQRTVLSSSCVYASNKQPDEYSKIRNQTTVIAKPTFVEPMPDGSMPAGLASHIDQQLLPRYQVSNGNYWAPHVNEWNATSLGEEGTTGETATMYYGDARWCHDDVTSYGGNPMTPQSSNGNGHQLALAYNNHVPYGAGHEYNSGSLNYAHWPGMSDVTNDVMHLQPNSAGGGCQFSTLAENVERFDQFSNDRSYNDANYFAPCYDNPGINTPNYLSMPHASMSHDLVLPTDYSSYDTPHPSTCPQYFDS